MYRCVAFWVCFSILLALHREVQNLDAMTASCAQPFCRTASGIEILLDPKHRKAKRPRGCCCVTASPMSCSIHFTGTATHANGKCGTVMRAQRGGKQNGERAHGAKQRHKADMEQRCCICVCPLRNCRHPFSKPSRRMKAFADIASLMHFRDVLDEDSDRS